MKQLETSIKKYNTRNWKSTTKPPCARIKMKTSSAYDIKEKEKASSTYENKENKRDGYVCIYEYGKLFCTSTFKLTCTAQEKTIIQIR